MLLIAYKPVGLYGFNIIESLKVILRRPLVEHTLITPDSLLRRFLMSCMRTCTWLKSQVWPFVIRASLLSYNENDSFSVFCCASCGELFHPWADVSIWAITKAQQLVFLVFVTFTTTIKYCDSLAEGFFRVPASLPFRRLGRQLSWTHVSELRQR